MMVTTIIEDPEYLTGPLILSSNYKKLPDTPTMVGILNHAP